MPAPTRDEILAKAIPRNRLPISGLVSRDDVGRCLVFDGEFRELQAVITINVETGQYRRFVVDEKGNFQSFANVPFVEHGFALKPIYLVPFEDEIQPGEHVVREMFET